MTCSVGVLCALNLKRKKYLQMFFPYPCISCIIFLLNEMSKIDRLILLENNFPVIWSTSFSHKKKSFHLFVQAFGNAKTAHNNNSSRFGKFIQVNYLESGVVRGWVPCGLYCVFKCVKSLTAHPLVFSLNSRIPQNMCIWGTCIQLRSELNFTGWPTTYEAGQHGEECFEELVWLLCTSEPIHVSFPLSALTKCAYVEIWNCSRLKKQW